jgi:dextranase
VIHPTHAFYRAGESVEIPIPGRFQATIWHLADQVAAINGKGALRWMPPAITHRGYRVRIQTESGDQWTAFDVLNHWTDMARYGYLYDFSPERTNFNLDWLLTHHINGLQFYDWQYRHDTLLAPASTYEDPLGRKLSLDTVRALIDAAHARGIAAMPYTAVYAASPAFAAAHPGWGLYDSEGSLYDFADGFLKLMNPASTWRNHFVQECRNVLAALPFDGIHVDQYGEPRAGFDVQGQPVDLPDAIAGTLAALHDSIPQDRALVFNLVHNWPLEAVCQTPVDFLYCELWPPKVTLGDIADTVTLNWTSANGYQPVVAVYVNPGHEHTVKLVQSVITASGGYHIAHGEDGLYLSDPYFPNSERPSPALVCQLKRIADFGVAYEELLALAPPVTIHAALEDDLWLITRGTQNRLALNLLNASPADHWNEPIDAQPVSKHVAVSVVVDRPVNRIWWASPDADAPPQPLNFHTENGALHFIIPRVETWSLVAIEFAERP